MLTIGALFLLERFSHRVQSPLSEKKATRLEPSTSLWELNRMGRFRACLVILRLCFDLRGFRSVRIIR